MFIECAHCHRTDQFSGPDRWIQFSRHGQRIFRVTHHTACLATSELELTPSELFEQAALHELQFRGDLPTEFDGLLLPADDAAIMGGTSAPDDYILMCDSVAVATA